MAQFQSVVIERIPREENERADSLSKLASASAQCEANPILKAALEAPSIDLPEEVRVVLEENNWRAPLIKYLAKGELPQEEESRKRALRQAPRFYLEGEELYKREMAKVENNGAASTKAKGDMSPNNHKTGSRANKTGKINEYSAWSKVEREKQKLQKQHQSAKMLLANSSLEAAGFNSIAPGSTTTGSARGPSRGETPSVAAFSLTGADGDKAEGSRINTSEGVPSIISSRESSSELGVLTGSLVELLQQTLVLSQERVMISNELPLADSNRLFGAPQSPNLVTLSRRAVPPHLQLLLSVLQLDLQELSSRRGRFRLPVSLSNKVKGVLLSSNDSRDTWSGRIRPVSGTRFGRRNIHLHPFWRRKAKLGTFLMAPPAACGPRRLGSQISRGLTLAPTEEDPEQSVERVLPCLASSLLTSERTRAGLNFPPGTKRGKTVRKIEATTGQGTQNPNSLLSISRTGSKHGTGNGLKRLHPLSRKQRGTIFPKPPSRLATSPRPYQEEILFPVLGGSFRS
ncbi:gag-pol polyprotein [Senna tora]|uniref:Gag-pol polyprotein n=1 Tax=Senna tora TaxID=362788 RepID=A0A834SXH2_9FABA|nr:gag-pol polyprotein [Senna tora]